MPGRARVANRQHNLSEPNFARALAPYTSPVLDLDTALANLDPQDLFRVWRWVDYLEECGVICPDAAHEWKCGIFQILEERGLEPDDIVPPLLETTPPV